MAILWVALVVCRGEEALWVMAKGDNKSLYTGGRETQFWLSSMAESPTSSLRGSVSSSDQEGSTSTVMAHAEGAAEARIQRSLQLSEDANSQLAARVVRLQLLEGGVYFRRWKYTLNHGLDDP